MAVAEVEAEGHLDPIVSAPGFDSTSMGSSTAPHHYEFWTRPLADGPRTPGQTGTEAFHRRADYQVPLHVLTMDEQPPRSAQYLAYQEPFRSRQGSEATRSSNGKRCLQRAPKEWA